MIEFKHWSLINTQPTFYLFNAIAKQLTEEEFERKETSTVSVHR